MTNSIFISWDVYDERSGLLAKHLGIPIHFFHFGVRKKILLLPFRYMVLAWRTWKFLMKEKPKIILVQTPPLPSAIVVHLYCVLYNARFAMDTHSGSIKQPWVKIFWLHRWLSRKAITTVVPNRFVEKVFTDMDLKAIRLGYTPENYEIKKTYSVDKKKFNISVPCSFGEDEPIEEIIDAAAELPEVGFYITGNLKYAPKNILKKAPENCYFTGYLSREDYLSLLAESDVIMDLTTDDFTVLMGAFEAISLEKPLITSNWPVLIEYFNAGTVYVDNSVEGIRNGILDAQNSYKELSQGIKSLKKCLEQDWNDQLSILKGQLYG